MRKHLLSTLATMLMLVATAGLLRAVAGPTQGQGQGQGRGRAQGQPQGERVIADSRFMTTAAQSGMAEVALSQLAQQQSTNNQLKGVAQKIQADHEKANSELKGLAAKKNVTIPAAPDPAHKQQHDRLSKMKGAEFDKAWIAQMIKDHQAAIDLFTQQSKTGEDAEVRAFAAKNLPALQAHLKQVQDLAKTGAAGGGSRNRARR